MLRPLQRQGVAYNADGSNDGGRGHRGEGQNCVSPLNPSLMYGLLEVSVPLRVVWV